MNNFRIDSIHYLGELLISPTNCQHPIYLEALPTLTAFYQTYKNHVEEVRKACQPIIDENVEQISQMHKRGEELSFDKGPNRNIEVEEEKILEAFNGSKSPEFVLAKSLIESLDNVFIRAIEDGYLCLDKIHDHTFYNEYHRLIQEHGSCIAAIADFKYLESDAPYTTLLAAFYGVRIGALGIGSAILDLENDLIKDLVPERMQSLHTLLEKLADCISIALVILVGRIFELLSIPKVDLIKYICNAPSYDEVFSRIEEALA